MRVLFRIPRWQAITLDDSPSASLSISYHFSFRMQRIMFLRLCRVLMPDNLESAHAGQWRKRGQGFTLLTACGGACAAEVRADE